jgi:predicted transcriptional regulator
VNATAEGKEERQMFNKNRFEKEVKEKGLRMQTVAEAMGIDRTTLYRKINGGPDFTLSEIQACRSLLGDDEIRDIFFAEEVS